MEKQLLKFALTVATPKKSNNTKRSPNLSNVTIVTGTVTDIDNGITTITFAGIEYTGDSYFSADNTKSFYYRDTTSPTGITHRLLLDKKPNDSVACYKCKPGDSVSGYIKHDIFHGTKINKL